MSSTPWTLCLPASAVPVDDVDEELFLIYTRKLQLGAPGGAAGSTALGYLEGRDGVLDVQLTIAPPLSSSTGTVTDANRGGRRAGRTKAAKEQKKEVLVGVEVHQSLDALRHRKGDTGSVLWRTSLHLAQYLLQSHHFPSPSHMPLLPLLGASMTLELGSGTGFLGLALRSIWAERGRWVFSDQAENLGLVVRNLRVNGARPLGRISAALAAANGGKMYNSKRMAPNPPPSWYPATHVMELDWLAEAAAWDAQPGSLYSLPSSSSHSHSRSAPASLINAPDYILAADCIYNPSLSAPLAKTILRRAGPHTVVVVACELRDEAAVEEFLGAWVELGEKDGWKVVRIEWGGEEEREAPGRIAEGTFALWVGWQPKAWPAREERPTNW